MTDFLTEECPSRTLLQEEEVQNEAYAAQFALPPRIQVPGNADGGLLVVGMGAAPCALLRGATQGAEASGRIDLPAIEHDPPAPYPLNHPHTGSLWLQNAPTTSSTTALVACEDAVPDERAVAWATAVLDAVQPAAVLVLTTVPAQEYSGDADPSDEPLMFQVASSSTPAAVLAPKVQPLPPHGLLHGAAAALVMRCQVQARPCVCLAAVSVGQVPDSAVVSALATAADAVAGSLAQQCLLSAVHLSAAAVVKSAQLRLDAKYRSSASASLYA